MESPFYPIVGAEVYIASRSMHDKEASEDRENYHLILLAQNATGYSNLVKLVTKANLEGMWVNRIWKKLGAAFQDPRGAVT